MSLFLLTLSLTLLLILLLTQTPPGNREILTMQESLRGLASRVSSVQADCTKAESDNEMLQAYIDSVTKSLAAKSNSGS